MIVIKQFMKKKIEEEEEEEEFCLEGVYGSWVKNLYWIDRGYM